jgi:uncharacterized SAM-binding protein YcdF (DUF218 family)
MSLRVLIDYVLPGSLLFLLAGLCLGVLLLYGSERFRRLGRLWLLLLAIFYVVASTRVGANVLLAPLYRHTAFVQDAASAQGATAIVLLNPGANSYRARGQHFAGIGKEAALRVLEVARVYRLLGKPLVIVAGGFPEQTDRPSLGVIHSKSLTDLGVPSDRIVIEPNSSDTRQHAENLKLYLEKRGIKKFVLVTSPFHMRRSVATFRAAGYDFVFSSAAVDSDLDADESPIRPDTENLDRVVFGVHEYMGLIYYWWNGWL